MCELRIAEHWFFTGEGHLCWDQALLSMKPWLISQPALGSVSMQYSHLRRPQCSWLGNLALLRSTKNCRKPRDFSLLLQPLWTALVRHCCLVMLFQGNHIWRSTGISGTGLSGWTGYQDCDTKIVISNKSTRKELSACMLLAEFINCKRSPGVWMKQRAFLLCRFEGFEGVNLWHTGYWYWGSLKEIAHG